MLFSLRATAGWHRKSGVPETQWYFYEPESSKNTLNKRNRWRRTENLKLFLTLQKWAENENINFIRVSFFLLEVARSESKGGDYDEGASSQEIKISRQLQNFFLSLSLIVLIKTMTRNHVVGGWLRICEARKMKNRLEEKLKNQVFHLSTFLMWWIFLWFGFICNCPSGRVVFLRIHSNHVESLDKWVRVLLWRGNLGSTIYSE